MTRLFPTRSITPVSMVADFCRTRLCLHLTVTLLVATAEFVSAGSANSPIPTETAQEKKAWSLQVVPDSWRSVPRDELAPIGGYSWYRALVRVPSDWKDTELLLSVEALDDARSAWINGRIVGLTGTFPPEFRSGLGEKGRYPIPADVVRPGELNTIAIRVYQSDPRPNFSVAPPVLMNESARQAIRLEGAWQYRPGDDTSWSQAKIEDFLPDPGVSLTDNESSSKGIYQRIDPVDDVEKYLTRRNGDTDPLSPEEAVRHFQTPEDLKAELVVGDPDIAQPLFIMFDERGRLWVLEYRQYPDPAGLKMLSRDTFLRSVYDKIPAPPPNHVRGLDRISIHEDSDGNGTFDRHSTFVDGLNIASSFALADGGVYVTNPPYLLFYPDKNHDDVPDADPVVLLEGFGIEDSHSVINSLRFGPDGWLYGAQGSTVTAAVRKPGSKDPPIRSVGQNIWRYHPQTGTYEVFAEGGGNTFGCEIDSKGRIFSGHNGGDTRGFHYVQGGYYRKGFGKHGPLSNPYTFGFFENIRHHSVPRFTHNFVIYEETALPKSYHGKLFGIEPLQGQVVLSDFRAYQSSFETNDIDRVLRTDDPWFRPVDIKAGPDGALYVADLYEQRIDHSSHYAGRIDRSSGRVYRLTSRDPEIARKTLNDALSKTSSGSPRDLIDALNSPNRWLRQTAIRLISDRNDKTLIPVIQQQLREASGQSALELLWALNVTGGLDDSTAVSLLSHQEPFVRSWIVRLRCDFSTISDALAEELGKLAVRETDIDVRKQLASSARRLPAPQGLPVIAALLSHDVDQDDIHQPLLLWWAVESVVARASVSEILNALLSGPADWERPIVSRHILQRLMRRYAAAGQRSDLLAAASLLKASPNKKSSDLLLAGFEEAFQGRSLASIPEELAAAITATGGGSLALRLRQGDAAALNEASTTILNSSADELARIQLIEILGQTAGSDSLRFLFPLLESEQKPAVLSAVLSALQRCSDDSFSDKVIARYPTLPEDARLTAETLLSSRLNWSLALMIAAENGKIKADTISETALRRMLLHGNQQLNSVIEKLRGNIAGATTTEMVADIQKISDILEAGSGNPRSGKMIFSQNCGRCHLLFEEGGRIGPDLTPFARDNTERLLRNIVNPGLEIREGFENHLIVTNDGRMLTGFLADKDPMVVVLRGIDGQNLSIPVSDIDEMKVLPTSVMPEGALRNLSEQQIRDLFAYLRSSQPVNY